MGITYSPDSATSEIGTPCSCAIKPRMEKMAKPATKLVPLFKKQRAMQSLGKKEINKLYVMGYAKICINVDINETKTLRHTQKAISIFFKRRHMHRL